LLDYLATRLIENGWSIKKLIREIAMSRTYQRSSNGDTKADPENRYFGRANRRRMDAEVLRDTMLAVSGQLTKSDGGQTYPASLAADYNHHPKLTCRSVYLPAFRNSRDELLDVFDGADPSMVAGRRDVSTVSPQALYLMNNAFPAEQAKHAAARLTSMKFDTPDASIDYAYRLSLGRLPTDGERAIAKKYLEANPKMGWQGLFHAIFASADFRFVN
jgi:hypothetical protein